MQRLLIVALFGFILAMLFMVAQTSGSGTGVLERVVELIGIDSSRDTGTPEEDSLDDEIVSRSSARLADRSRKAGRRQVSSNLIDGDSETVPRVGERIEGDDVDPLRKDGGGSAATNRNATTLVIGDQSRSEGERGSGVDDDDLDSDSAVVEVFQEAARIEVPPDTGRIGGVTINRGASSLFPGGGETSGLGNLPVDEAQLLPRVAGQARGYSMLYLMQPQARATVEGQIETMLRAEVRDLYLGVLADGTFGEDRQYLASVLRRLTQGGRSVTLVLYLSNGATMRSFDSTVIVAGFNQIEPNRFRNQIIRDQFLRQRFVTLVEGIVPIVEFNASLNPANRTFVSVMLEDNLDQPAYRAMRDLAASVLRGRAQLVRSPCVGCCASCRPPSDDVSQDGVELHRIEDLPRHSRITGFTLDGIGLSFPGEIGNGLAADQVANTITASRALGAEYFGLWRQERQGIFQRNERLVPSERSYEVPTEEQRPIEIALLRFGLTTEEASAAPTPR